MDTVERLQQHQQYIQNQRRQLENLRGQVERLEKLFFLTCPDPQLKWLFENRSERMDPNVPIFDEGRANFHLDRYVFASNHVAGKRVVDIACGTGYGSRLLKESGNAESVVGVDIASDAIEYATKKHLVDDVKFLVGDGTETCFHDKNFDIAVSFETIEHVPDDRKLLIEFHRILKPGGLLICSTPNLWPLAIAPHHVREYDHDSFVTALSEHFDVIEMYNQNSGTTFEYNRDQPRGIVPTTADNQATAECFIAIARRKE